jgi:gamma-glutamylcyclotransferase (GGCT)/AIG2-like uncharacterized protein YtfP
MTAPTLLFVYGSLRTGSGSLMAERLSSGATPLGPASVPGALYHAGEFPAMLASDNPDDRVVGEVWALHPASAESLLQMLDQYEGFSPDERFSSLFVRERVIAQFDDGSEQESWMYRYGAPLPEDARIPSGDWLLRD